MASNKFKYPPAPPNARGTFSDNLVGLQFHDGGELTQSNFEFTTKVVERIERKFNTGVFSKPISLNDIDVKDINKGNEIFDKELGVAPNFDKSQVVNFTLYGSVQKRFSTSISKIINFFPAAIEVNKIFYNYSTGHTAYDIVYDALENTTTFKVDVSRVKNPFGVDYTTSSSININNKKIEVSKIRDLTNNFTKYAVYTDNLENEYIILDFDPCENQYFGFIQIEVDGNIFSGQTQTEDTFVIKPNRAETNREFKYNFDEVEDFFLNRDTNPIYTSVFQVIKEGESGKLYKSNEKVKWPLDGLWNLDIRSEKFDRYLDKINKISVDLDEFRTNLISRFLTAGTLKDFDTQEKKFESILQIYGRNFDEIKKYIDALSHINSVNYTVKDDIPSELLKDLSNTIGWERNISPNKDNQGLTSIFNIQGKSKYPGREDVKSPNELNYQYYRNLILNTAYLFKSKGTLRAIKSLLNLIGAPQSLIDINESIYIADNLINVNLFNEEYAKLSGGTRLDTDTVFNDTTTSILGQTFNNFSSINRYVNVNETRDDYPIDNEGYPKKPRQTEDMFFQKGAGWYKSTPSHRSIEIVDTTGSVFTGQNADIQTKLEPFTYGQKYLNQFRKLPNMRLGFNIFRVDDNKKSWVDNSNTIRKNFDAGLNAFYTSKNDKLILNAKNLDISLNMGRGIMYDIWQVSRRYGQPITKNGLINGYPQPEGLDWTIINPDVKNKTFFEFNRTFFKNMINVRDRMYIKDSIGGGYPALQKLFWDYRNYEKSNNYTYQKTIDFTNGIGDYWMKLVEQMIPATTLWMGGQKFENSPIHRQKFDWKRQRKSYTNDEPIPSSIFVGSLFPYDCKSFELNCDITYRTQQTDLINTVNTVVGGNGFEYGDCDMSTITTEWFVVIKINEDVVYNGTSYYNGAGINDYPSQTQWNNEVSTAFNNLNGYDLGYELTGNNIRIFNIDCNEDLTNDSISIESKIKIITINCE